MTEPTETMTLQPLSEARLAAAAAVYRSDDAPRAVATWLEPGRLPPSTIGMLRTGLLRLLWSGGLSDARRLLTLGDTFDRLHKQDMTQLPRDRARAERLVLPAVWLSHAAR